MNVESIRCNFQFFHAGDGLRCKRFIDFEQVYIGNFGACFLKQFFNCPNGRQEKVLRFSRKNLSSDNSIGRWFRQRLIGSVAEHDDGGCAVAKSRCVPRSHGTICHECRLEFGQFF